MNDADAWFIDCVTRVAPLRSAVVARDVRPLQRRRNLTSWVFRVLTQKNVWEKVVFLLLLIIKKLFC
jgi:hypothetical protein